MTSYLPVPVLAGLLQPGSAPRQLLSKVQSLGMGKGDPCKRKLSSFPLAPALSGEAMGAMGPPLDPGLSLCLSSASQQGGHLAFLLSSLALPSPIQTFPRSGLFLRAQPPVLTSVSLSLGSSPRSPQEPTGSPHSPAPFVLCSGPAPNRCWNPESAHPIGSSLVPPSPSWPHLLVAHLQLLF